MKIAVCGKGGVGKTFIAGALACRFAQSGYRTLVIDADTSPNLAMTLGLDQNQAERIIPVAEDENLIKEKTDTDFPGVFRLTYTVDDIIRNYSVATPCGASLLVMGTVRTAGGGCACPAHSLVRSIMNHLVLQNDDVVIMDMEAGIEHLGRGTAEHVDLLLVVTDANQVSLVTAGRIVTLARETGIAQIAYLGNRVMNEEMSSKILAAASEQHANVIGTIPFDQEVFDAGVFAKSPIYQINSPAILSMNNLADILMGKGDTA